MCISDFYDFSNLYYFIILIKSLTNIFLDWASSADYYWPMDKVLKGIVDGTIPAKTMNSTFSSPVKFNPNSTKEFLAFDGASNYLTIDNVRSLCMNHPDSSECPHGFTVSFVFKYSQAVSTREKIILDTMGYGNDAAGFKVFIQNNQIVTKIKSTLNSYESRFNFPKDKWNHYAFSLSALNGLYTYLNGNKT